jgi:hypothetical protein
MPRHKISGQIGRGSNLNVEPHIGESRGKVETVHPYLIGLAKQAFTGIGHSSMPQRDLMGSALGYSQDRTPAAGENPSDLLLHGLAIPRHVLEHVAGHDEIERPLLDVLHVSNAQLHVDSLPGQIGG